MLFISLHEESALNSILGKILNTCICGTYGFEVKTKIKVLNLENFSVLQIIDCVSTFQTFLGTKLLTVSSDHRVVYVINKIKLFVEFFKSHSL